MALRFDRDGLRDAFAVRRMRRRHGGIGQANGRAPGASPGPGGPRSGLEGGPGAGPGGERLATAVAVAPIILFALDRRGVVTFTSGGGLATLELQPSELVGRSGFDIFRGAGEVPSALRRALHGAAAVAAFERGDLVYQASFSPELDPRGAVTGAIGVLIDVTATRRAAEAALDESDRSLARARRAADLGSWDVTDRREADAQLSGLDSIVDQVADSVMVTDAAGRITYVNPAFERVSGYGRAEVLGRSPSLLKSGRHGPEFYADMWATITSGRPWTGTVVNRRRDGNLYEADVTISPFTNPDGRITGYVEVARDMTDVRALEAQLRQASKMDAIGRLAGGIAHDFNNLLTVVSGYTGMLLADLDPSDPHREAVEEIARAADRAGVLTRELLAFSRRQVLQRRRLDLNAIVTDTQAMLRRTLGEGIVLDVRLQPGLWSVLTDPGHMVQVILNLAINARDAMPAGGTLTIETRNVIVDARSMATGHAGPPDEYVLLSVRDTGVGLSEEAKAHLFEPFFTTKAQGKGTGLGLASVYGIVKQSHGYILVDSAPDAGTSFDIYLPRAVGDPEPLEPRPAPAAQTAGSRTLLLVDDDPAVLGVAEATLARHGYRVLTATSAEEALAVAARHPEPIDLLITDVVLPGQSGGELVERVAVDRPGLAVLLISGHANELLDLDLEEATEPSLLTKPFTPVDLLTAVARALEVAGG